VSTESPDRGVADVANIDLQHLVSPRLLQSRAAVVSVECATAGVGAGIALSIALLSLMRPKVVLTIATPPLVLQTLLVVAACGAFGFTWRYQVGRSATQGDPLWGDWRWISLSLLGLLVTSLGTLVCVFAWPKGFLWAVATSALFSLGTLAAVGLRSLGALQGRSTTPVADLAFCVAHCLLAGMAICVGLGLMQAKMTAELTYEAGVSLSVLSFWTLCAAGRVMWRAQAFLRQERKQGRRWPTSERSSRNAMLIVTFGILTPAAVTAMALMMARITGVEMACLAMALSVHGLRHACTTMRYGPDPRIDQLQSSTIWPLESEAHDLR